MQLREFKSTNSTFFKKKLCQDLTKIKKLNNHCNKASETTTKEARSKMNAERELIRDNLKAAAKKNAKQENSIKLFKQDCAYFKANDAKKSEATERLEKNNDQFM